MPRPLKLLFLQLPLLDNDVTTRPERARLAEIYLTHALQTSPEARFFKAMSLSERQLEQDDRSLKTTLLALRPDVLVCTLYVWNIERTRALASRLKKEHPALIMLGGGPEVARNHPFLFDGSWLDAAVMGPGESVFPALLHAVRTRKKLNYRHVVQRTSRGYTWGTAPEPAVPLSDILPPASSPLLRPDRHGMAYLEASRGCPLRCTYCCYSQHGRRVDYLPVDEVIRRIVMLKKRGAREIRFIDPTFNAHPHFDRLLHALARINPGRTLKFFGELRGDTLTSQQARALKKAGFAEVEIGVQSTQPHILKVIRRPWPLHRIGAALRELHRNNVRVTLDLMYGLPLQTLNDVRSSLRWAAGRPGVRVQCLQTLLLPGTELRATAENWGLSALNVPPYSVQSTPDLPSERLARVEDTIERMLGSTYDCPTRRWIESHLPDLFEERVDWHAARDVEPRRLAGISNRRAVIIRGSHLYTYRDRICALIRRALTDEPHIHWQFVPAMEWEEPLDLLEALIATVCAFTPLVADHMLGVRFNRLHAARRIMVLLPPRRRFNAAWRNAAQDLLSSRFY